MDSFKEYPKIQNIDDTIKRQGSRIWMRTITIDFYNGKTVANCTNTGMRGIKL